MANKFLIAPDGTFLKYASSSETWVINETPTIPTTSGITYEINFTCNGNSYSKIKFYKEVSDDPYIYYSLIESSTPTVVYNYGGWVNAAYRTVTFETSPTGDLLTWLQSNAVKQESSEETFLQAGSKSYTINYTCVECTSASTNPTTISEDETVTATFTPDSGFEIAYINAYNCTTVSKSLSSGTITINNPTGNVTIAANAEKA